MIKGALFSEYFLTDGIKNTKDWQSSDKQRINEIFERAKKIFLEFSNRKNPDETDTEDSLIIPFLKKVLGFEYSRQKSPNKKGRQDIFDFVLFEDEKSKKEFDEAERDKRPWENAVCILEAKRWGRHLDRGDKSDTLDPHVPSNQILRYLSSVELASKGKVLWGILTNGKVWRLYYHKASSRAEGFIEFDLNEIFSTTDLNNLEKFKIFYLLFRKLAFIPTNWRSRPFLEIALEEGKKWEERVSENLKDKIFDEVFPDIAKGLLENCKKKGKNIDEKLLKDIYDNTLVLLYRFLFLFYAEDRDLLPVRFQAYKNYSLSKIRDEIAKKIEQNEILSETASSYWDRLKNLFKIIDQGDRNLKVPPYNGGLFDTSKHQFLEKFEVVDKYLVPAIDKLSRDYSENPPKRINYRDLSVRQLGSIYEGLLEFKLKIADKHLAIKKIKGKEIYYSIEDESKAKIKKGDIYLTNDKAERKATGSYYTPDFIVQYIVKNTIEPIIQENLEEFENWKKKLTNIKSKQELLKLFKENKIEFDPKIYDKDNKQIIGEKNINAYKNELLKAKDPTEALLERKILDPAMGSGHFLVGAVDYIGDRILEVLSEISDQNYFGEETYQSPLLEKLENIRKQILNTAEKQGYEIDEAKLDDKNLIKRIILKRCIYGVDVNPLAVELAKVSLWLHTFTVGAPLSFLDHHLKCGNSLVGAEPEEIKKVISTNLFGSRYAGLLSAVNMIQEIQNLTDTDISEVEKSAELYEEVVKGLEPYKRILDLYLAEFFVSPKLVKKYYDYLDSVRNGNKNTIQPWAWGIMQTYNPLEAINGKIDTHEGIKLMPQDDREKLKLRFEIAKRKQFFHWKLEFPEVWYDKNGLKENGGFDIVIGNPPYIMEVRENKEIFRDLQKSPTVSKYYEDKMDIFYFFIEYGLDLLKEKGYLGYIVQEYWTTRSKATKLRKKVFSETSPQKFILFKDFKVFKDAPGQHNMILILQKKKFEENDKVHISILNTKSDKLKDKNYDEQVQIIHNEIEKEEPQVFNSFKKKLAIVYSKKTDKVYIDENGLNEKLEMLKMNKDYFDNLFENEIQQGVVTPQHFLRGSGESIFVLREDTFKQYSWTTDEKLLLKPFYYAEEIDRYFYPQTSPDKFLIYTPINECIKIEAYYLNQKIDSLSDNDIETFMAEYTPHLLKRIKRNDVSKETVKSYLKNFKYGNYQNIVHHLLKFKEYITSDNKPFGIHRARQPEWFEDPQKIIGVRKTKYPKFAVVEKIFYMDQSVFIIRLTKHNDYSPYYITAILNSRLGWWWFYHQKRQGEQLQIDKEVLLNFPLPRIDFSSRKPEKLNQLKNLYESGNYDLAEQILKKLPPNSVVLHDFLDYLARKMTELNHNKYLLKQYINNKIDSGTEDMIKVIELLEKHSHWEDTASESRKKEIAKSFMKNYENQIEKTDKIIDYTVYHLYNLTEDEIKKIEKDKSHK